MSNKNIKINDVFVAIWGYEQTNVTYFQVVSLIGKTMVGIREIKSERNNPDSYRMRDSVKPSINNFQNDKILRKKVNVVDSNRPFIRIESYMIARLEDYCEIKGFKERQESSYA